MKTISPNSNKIATIHSLSHDGRGIAAINHKTTFIQGALPNETVRYQLQKKHANYDEAMLTEIITAADNRAQAKCPHFGICGGCSLQHMPDQLQLEFKQASLLEQLKHFGQACPERILPPLVANTWGYRRKARLGVKFVIKKNKVLVGFREKSSRYLADLTACHTLHPAIGMHLTDIAEMITQLEAKQAIPQIEVAIGDEQIALVFRHLTDLTSDDRDKLIAFGEKYKMQIFLQPNAPQPIEKIYPDDQQCFLTYSLPQQQLRFLFHPLDFTQINLELNSLMVSQALQLLDLQTHDQVLDLFCGLGNFSLPIAKYAQHVVGIEGETTMVERATLNAHHNQIMNAEFYAANLAAPNEQAAWMLKPYTKIVLDPPRTGAKEIIPHLEKFAATKILYISCNPATLARDTKEFVHNYGYRLTCAGIMNMFPHTAHTEAMALFEK